MRNEARLPPCRGHAWGPREASPCRQALPFPRLPVWGQHGRLLLFLQRAFQAVLPAYSSSLFIFLCQITRTSGPVLSRRGEHV